MSQQVAQPSVPKLPAVASASLVVALVCGGAAFMETLDTAIANVSLLHIAGSLSASPEESTWVLTSYLVANAIILPMTGWLADTIGRRRYYLISMALFTLTSVLCGLAPSLPWLIVFRVLQGMAGGALQPISQSILADAYPGEKRGRAMAVYGMAVISAPAIGPTLGGLLTENYSWHWIFLINAPVGLLLMLGASAVVRDSPAQLEVQRRRRTEPFTVDYVGFALITLCMGALQIMLDKGQQDDWLESGFICGCLAVTVISGVALVWRELTHAHPVVNLRLLKQKNFAIASLLIFGMGIPMMGTGILLPQMLQSTFGYSSLDAGLVLSPAAFVTLVMMPMTARLVARFDPRLICTLGFLMVAAGVSLLTHISLEVTEQQFVWLRVAQLAGIAFIFLPINVLAYVGIAAQDTGSATSIINLMRNIGGSVGISLVVAYLARASQVHQATLVNHVNLLDPAYQQTLQSLSGLSGGIQTAHAAIAQMIAQQASLLGYIDTFVLMTMVCSVLAFLPWLARRGNGAAPPPGAH